MRMSWITALGPGVSPDSIVYLDTARSLQQGDGFSAGGEPVTHYPPAYPILLVIFSSFQNGDVLASARTLSALLFGLNAMLVGLLVYLSSQKNGVAAAFSVIFFFSAAPGLAIHAMVLTEALFLFFTLACFLLLAAYTTTGRLGLLVLVTLLAGGAIVTRYIGVAIIPPILLVLILDRRHRISIRLRQALIFLGISFLPLFAWMLRNQLIADTATNRTLVFHLITAGQLRTLLEQFVHLFLPVTLPLWAHLLLVTLATLLFLGGVLGLIRKGTQNSDYGVIPKVIFTTSTAFFFAYLIFLVFSVSFFDAHTPFDARLLFPPFIFINIAVVSLVWALGAVFEKQWIRYAWLILVTLVILLNIPAGLAEAFDTHMNGKGFNSLTWANSPTLAWVKSLPVGLQVVSNGPDVILFQTGKRAVMIPGVTDPTRIAPNPDFAAELNEVCRDLKNQEAVFVYLKNITWRWYLLTTPELVGACELPLLTVFEDGEVYGGGQK